MEETRQDFDETRDYGKNFFKSKTTKIISIIVVVALIVIGSAFTFYKTQKDSLFNNISTDIINLNTTVAGFKNGLNQNAQYLNPSFVQNYQNDFTKLISSMQGYQGSMFNDKNSAMALKKEISKAQYYDYMTQFAGQVVSYKNDFTPLIDAVQNGTQVTKDQAQKMENDLQALEGSNALTEAMNIYNAQNVYMDRGIESPYSIKQNIINLNNSIKNGDFSKATNNKAQQNMNKQINNILFTNLI